MKHSFIIATVALLLTACGGGGTSSDGGTSTNNTGGTSTGGSILVTNTSGGQTDIAGTWVRACTPGTPGLSFAFDVQSYETFNGNTHERGVYQYTTQNGTCTGAATIAHSLTDTLVLQADIATVGWKDATGFGFLPTPPMAQNGAGPLPATPSATSLLDTHLGGTVATFARVVDATDAAAGNIVMYNVTIGNTNGATVDSVAKFTKQ